MKCEGMSSLLVHAYIHLLTCTEEIDVEKVCGPECLGHYPFMEFSVSFDRRVEPFVETNEPPCPTLFASIGLPDRNILYRVRLQRGLKFLHSYSVFRSCSTDEFLMMLDHF